MQRPRLLSSLSALILIALCGVGVAHADRDFHHRDGWRDGRHAFHDEHWRLDSRYHHDRYYPRIGYSLSVLPPGYLSIGFHDRHLFFDAGVWYALEGSNYVVVAPPIGAFVPVLPPAYTTIWIGPTPYYYANGTYYSSTDGGYMTVAPPEGYQGAALAPPPQAAPVQPAGDLLFVYPRYKKTDEQIRHDRSACTQQATEGTGYDPTQAGVNDPRRGDYLRAVSTCLEKRGYKVR